ncbi:MAG: hypothetical protein GXY03_00315, partial [Solirubrobacterales bacterium]|nr:hypothetical protein [Solirubrobacterales bacterium]
MSELPDGHRGRGTWATLALSAALVVAVLLGLPSAASAEFGFVPGSVSAEAVRADGTTLETQAGAVPYEGRTVFELNSTMTTYTQGSSTRYATQPDRSVKDIQVDLPAGFVGDPNATPKCPRSRIAAGAQVALPCPASTQVGTIKLTFGTGRNGGATSPGASTVPHQYPVYNVVPRRGELADFTFVVAALGGTHIVGSIRAGDYGVRTDIRNISVSVPLIRSELTLWGVPADPAHDPLRGYVMYMGFPLSPGGLSSGAAPRAFLRNQTSCDGSSPSSTFRVRQWEDPSYWVEETVESPAITGCEKLSFTPSMDVVPTESAADAPTGLDVDIDLPQPTDPVGLDSPHLKDVSVALPDGMSINPAGAGGLVACSDAQLKLGSDDPVGCPAASRIGSVEATSPTLDETLSGGVFVRSQASDVPESGEMFRLALVLESAERGLSIRLPGAIKVDPGTGRVVAEFANNPQLPVDSVRLRLKSGPRAALATPADCGAKTVDATLTSWAGHSVDLQSSFDVDCAPVLGSFAPSFAAGSAMPVAGADSAFVLRVDKPDGQSALNGVELVLPKGLLANLAGNVGKRVGTARVAAGPGSQPYWLSGPVVLEGAYGDAPFSLRVTVPAQAGPYDLGDVVVRQKLYVDPVTAQVTVVSDPLPTIVKGVPVRLQKLAVDVDKPGFVVNPTSCEEMTVGGTLGSATGQTAEVRTRFQVGECQALDFEPKLGLRLIGKRQTKTGGHPALKAVLGQADGQANIRLARVVMPDSVVLDPENSVDPAMVCDYDASLKAECPESTVIGTARAVTPLLDRPLSGKVHLVQGIRFGPTGNRIRTTPSLLVKLAGEVDVHLYGRTTVRKGRLVTVFKTVPDAQVTRFAMRIRGGNKGILVITGSRQGNIDICQSRQTANLAFTGHNGKRAGYRRTVRTPCAKA